MIPTEAKSTAGELETWAIVEVFGHQRLAGFVRQVPMGGAVMLRVDVPELPEEAEEYDSYAYDNEGRHQTVKKTRTLTAVPSFTQFLGVASIFRLTPCTEEAARLAQRKWREKPTQVLQAPPRLALPGMYRDDDEG